MVCSECGEVVVGVSVIGRSTEVSDHLVFGEICQGSGMKMKHCKEGLQFEFALANSVEELLESTHT